MNRKFLICNTCGNIIETINNKNNISCCGSKMVELTANTTDAATEKHVPKVSIENNIATIEVGETLHPMTNEHYIEWISIETTNDIKRVHLTPNDQPIVRFALLENEKVTRAYAYCNLHSLWMKELD